MKEKILKLRKEGKSYREIQKELKCSTSTISYHCGEGQKEKSAQRQRNRRVSVTSIIKKKINRFNTRAFKNKVRDFKRERTLQGSWKNKGEVIDTFNIEELIKKIKDNPYCYLTGDKIDLSKSSSFSFDHIIPISNNGDSSLKNLGLCTREANMSKFKLELSDYFELCRKVLTNNGYEVIKLQ